MENKQEGGRKKNFLLRISKETIAKTKNLLVFLSFSFVTITSLSSLISLKRRGKTDFLHFNYIKEIDLCQNVEEVSEKCKQISEIIIKDARKLNDPNFIVKRINGSQIFQEEELEENEKLKRTKSWWEEKITTLVKENSVNLSKKKLKWNEEKKRWEESGIVQKILWSQQNFLLVEPIDQISKLVANKCWKNGWMVEIFYIDLAAKILILFILRWFFGTATEKLINLIKTEEGNQDDLEKIIELKKTSNIFWDIIFRSGIGEQPFFLLKILPRKLRIRTWLQFPLILIISSYFLFLIKIDLREYRNLKFRKRERNGWKNRLRNFLEDLLKAISIKSAFEIVISILQNLAKNSSSLTLIEPIAEIRSCERMLVYTSETIITLLLLGEEGFNKNEGDNWTR